MEDSYPAVSQMVFRINTADISRDKTSSPGRWVVRWVRCRERTWCLRVCVEVPGWPVGWGDERYSGGEFLLSGTFLVYLATAWLLHLTGGRRGLGASELGSGVCGAEE